MEQKKRNPLSLRKLRRYIKLTVEMERLKGLKKAFENKEKMANLELAIVLTNEMKDLKGLRDVFEVNEARVRLELARARVDLKACKEKIRESKGKLSDMEHLFQGMDTISVSTEEELVSASKLIHTRGVGGGKMQAEIVYAPNLTFAAHSKLKRFLLRKEDSHS
ncbi:uncharacterized protein LOC132303930 [Cornus florida]|uniref:uncharacterized protein LOC132303929 n=1 Tax=Cornus florida TaxID=4283 RepID=UPI00289AE09E|nr:uncharacterized protein LOC132303929 [Cornus florida]XP_059657366.1 uncharacterized protein LOC132303930 [Cornus florida]